MKSQSALFTFFLLSACLANTVSAQTHYHQNLMVPLQAVAYPQTQHIRGWNADFPGNFVAISQDASQPYVAPPASAPIVVGYMPMVASPPPANRDNYAMPQQGPQRYMTPSVPTQNAVRYIPMVASPPPANRGNYSMPSQVPYHVVAPSLAAPVRAGYLPLVASPPAANHGNAGVLQHSLQPKAPFVVGYVHMSTTPTPENISYATPMVAPRSYWTDMPTSSGLRSSQGYYGLTPTGQHRLNVPVRAWQPEGSVLGQPSLLNNGHVTPSCRRATR
jgi:hypothetical protein